MKISNHGRVVKELNLKSNGIFPACVQITLIANVYFFLILKKIKINLEGSFFLIFDTTCKKKKFTTTLQKYIY